MPTPEEELAARVAAAAELRRLGHALVERQVDLATLAEIRATAGALADAVESGATRSRSVDEAPLFESPQPSGRAERPRHLFADSIVSGGANPLGIDATLWRDGDEAVMEVVLGPAFEGAPGRAHGGIVAALIDETMGLVLGIVGTPAFTGRLTITYRAPTPLGTTLVGRARMTDRRGRKLIMAAEVTAGDQLIAEGEALFIAVDPASFLAGAKGMDPQPEAL